MRSSQASRKRKGGSKAVTVFVCVLATGWLLIAVAFFRSTAARGDAPTLSGPTAAAAGTVRTPPALEPDPLPPPPPPLPPAVAGSPPVPLERPTALAVATGPALGDRPPLTVPDFGADSVWTGDVSQLPPFWEPPEGVDLDSAGLEVGGHPTVYLMVASYRDFQCRETIASAFDRAAFPERVFVGAVEQNAAGDVGCTQPPRPCAEDESQTLCRYRSQIRLFKIDARFATGPTFGRHVGDRLYRGEHYAMQVDAHVVFVRDWDELMIRQFLETKNDYAILSTYLTDLQGSIDKDGRSKRNTRPIMCNSKFEGSGETSHLRHLAQPEERALLQDEPMLHPFWAAGMSFSRGHFLVRVPYDCCLPLLFQGEEISVGIRAWTHGYDMYAPHSSVVFHEYAVNSGRRRGVHHFWENAKGGNAQRSMRRMVALIKMSNGVNPDSFDHTDEHKYGLGTARPVELFYHLFGLNVDRHTMVPELCKFVKSGVMHETFRPALRADGKGIDYSGFADFDVAAAIQTQLQKLQETAAVHIRNQMKRGSIGGIRNALEEAKRARLDKANPGLMEEARAKISEIEQKGR